MGTPSCLLFWMGLTEGDNDRVLVGSEQSSLSLYDPKGTDP